MNYLILLMNFLSYLEKKHMGEIPMDATLRIFGPPYPVLHGQVEFHARGHPYLIDLVGMAQINLNTGMQRDAWQWLKVWHFCHGDSHSMPQSYCHFFLGENIWEKLWFNMV